MNHHQELILNAADLTEAVAEPLTDEGMCAMLTLVDAIAASLALASAGAPA